MLSSFSKRAVEIMKRIPAGKVGTYGQIATYAGNNRGAQQIVRLLKSSWEKENLPWHRVVNAKGESSIGEEQITRLEAEGIVFNENGRIDLKIFGWDGLDEITKYH